MYYIYILYSPTVDKYYIGYTKDYRQRLHDHNTQDFFNTYTSKYRPWQLAAVFECGASESDAIKLERYIKKQKSRSLMLKLVDPVFVPTGNLAKLFRVPHMRD